MSVTDQLARLNAGRIKALDPAALDALIQAVLRIYPDAVSGILVYGSCLRSRNFADGLIDLYVIVGDYKKAYRNPIHRLLNRWLAPNVYYLEVPLASHLLRAKYAVISLQDFDKGTSTRWFHSYLWGRFAQPAALVYSRNTDVKNKIYDCLAQAVATFCLRTLPHLPPRFDSAQLWRDGLALSYGAELRAERPDRVRLLVDAAEPYYGMIARATLKILTYAVVEQRSDGLPVFTTSIPRHLRIANRAAWWARRIQGKILSVLRLLKGLITFQGGVDYIVWKLERHSGEKIVVSPRVRRYPAIFIWGLFWRLYRRGIFR